LSQRGRPAVILAALDANERLAHVWSGEPEGVSAGRFGFALALLEPRGKYECHPKRLQTYDERKSEAKASSLGWHWKTKRRRPRPKSLDIAISLD
jgi:hypothetical protein